MPAYRSLNGDLHEGETDGKYKKVINDRGGVVEKLSYANRVDLADQWYGIHEEPNKVAPGTAKVVRTPNFVPTPPVR